MAAPETMKLRGEWAAFHLAFFVAFFRAYTQLLGGLALALPRTDATFPLYTFCKNSLSHS
jgi:hypothetical protein